MFGIMIILFMNLMDNVVQLRKLQMWIWANKRWKIWQKTNICGENFTVKHWTIITLKLLNILRWRDRSVLSNIVKLNSPDWDIEWSQSGTGWGQSGHRSQSREERRRDESFISWAVWPRLASPGGWCKGVLRGELGLRYEIWDGLITPRISISLLPSSARGLPCPPIGQTEVDISAGRGRGGGRAWFLTGIHNRAVMWHKARSEEGERPRETQGDPAL